MLFGAGSAPVIGNVMSEKKSRPPYPGQGAAAAKPRGASVRGKGRSLKLAWLSLSAGAVVMAAAFVLAPRFVRNVPSAELTTSNIDPHRMASIVIDDGVTKCAHATFDNRTGQIAQGPQSCRPTVDADSGAAERLNAISNAFK